MFYLDSSVAVSAVSAEISTATVLEWLGTNDDLSISDWVITEAAAALSQKRRTGVVSAEEHRAALDALQGQIGTAYPSVAVTRQDFRLAARFVERPETGLRAADALHLALASATEATLVTLDKAQARAGQLLGVPTLLL